MDGICNHLKLWWSDGFAHFVEYLFALLHLTLDTCCLNLRFVFTNPMDNLWFVCVLLWCFCTGSAAIIIIIIPWLDLISDWNIIPIREHLFFGLLCKLVGKIKRSISKDLYFLVFTVIWGAKSALHSVKTRDRPSAKPLPQGRNYGGQKGAAPP